MDEAVGFLLMLFLGGLLGILLGVSLWRSPDTTWQHVAECGPVCQEEMDVKVCMEQCGEKLGEKSKRPAQWEQRLQQVRQPAVEVEEP